MIIIICCLIAAVLVLALSFRHKVKNLNENLMQAEAAYSAVYKALTLSQRKEDELRAAKANLQRDELPSSPPPETRWKAPAKKKRAKQG